MDAKQESVAEMAKLCITESSVKAALKADKGDNACLISWTIKDFTNKGDNYATFVTSVEVTYSLENINHTVTYIVKIPPCRDLVVMNDVLSVICGKEIRFHEELTPELNSQLALVGEAPIRVPKCYYTSLKSGKEIIFMEDLRARGFKMFDRRISLSNAHVKLILQELARLHAASLLLLDSGKENIIENMKDIVSKDWLNYSEEACGFSQAVLSGCADNAISILDEASGYERAVKWLKELKPKISDTLISQVQRCEPFVVLCHNDCWTSNLLYRYDESNNPVEVMMVDLQLIRMTSPATDISYLLYTAINVSERKNNIDHYLGIYHDTLQKVLKAGERQVPFSRQQLQQEYQDKWLFGVISAVMIVPTVIGDDNEVPDMEEFLSEESQNKQKDALRKIVHTCSRLRPRFIEIFDDLMDKGFIP